MSTPAHYCHAAQCNVHVPPKMFMCRKHWSMLPLKLRAALWAAYRPGQEIRKDPTEQYLIVASECICFVADAEGVSAHEHVRGASSLQPRTPK